MGEVAVADASPGVQVSVGRKSARVAERGGEQNELVHGNGC
jgi:hypothetical protein